MRWARKKGATHYDLRALSYSPPPVKKMIENAIEVGLLSKERKILKIPRKLNLKKKKKIHKKPINPKKPNNKKLRRKILFTKKIKTGNRNSPIYTTQQQ